MCTIMSDIYKKNEMIYMCVYNNIKKNVKTNVGGVISKEVQRGVSSDGTQDVQP